MLNVLQTRLQQCVNWEFPDVQTRFRKGKGNRDWIVNNPWIIKKAREVQKNIYFCYTEYAQQTVESSLRGGKLFKRLKYQTTLVVPWGTHIQVKKQQWELIMGQGTSQNWERNVQGFILSPCLFNLYAEYIMWNVELDEAQAGIKISRRNTNNPRYADDSTIMAENKELKIFFMKVKEES